MKGGKRPAEANEAPSVRPFIIITESFRLARWIVAFFGVALIIYVAIPLPLKYTAGKETAISLVYNVILDVRWEVILPYVLAVALAGLWVRERRIRKMSVQREHVRVEILEKDKDPNRTSSGLEECNAPGSLDTSLGNCILDKHTLRFYIWNQGDDVMSTLSSPFFHDEYAAYEKLESLLWPHGPVCPRCGGLDRITPVKGGRIGLYRCGPCKRQFTVTVGTIFESSHVKLPLWFQATHLLCSSKKGMSAHQIHRILGVTYKTAWFMCHRLREAMREGHFSDMLGGQKPSR